MFSCCTDLYQLPITRLLLGDSFHPGGLETTKTLAEQSLIHRNSQVLDIATGQATSAAFLVEQYGANVFGLDMGMENLLIAKDKHSNSKLHLIRGNALQLPFLDSSLDVVMCECSLCTFGERALALSEFYRVLKPNGFVAISDIFINRPLPAALVTSLSLWLCVSGAQSSDINISEITTAGFNQVNFTDQSCAMVELIESILKKIAHIASIPELRHALLQSLASLPESANTNSLETLQQLSKFIELGGAGYYTITARK